MSNLLQRQRVVFLRTARCRFPSTSLPFLYPSNFVWPKSVRADRTVQTWAA